MSRGRPIRSGRRRGCVLSAGSRTYDRSSLGVAIAPFVSVSSDLVQPGKEPTLPFPHFSTGRSDTARPDCGTSCLSWLIGSHLKGFDYSSEACSEVGRVRVPPEKSIQRTPACRTQHASWVASSCPPAQDSQARIAWTRKQGAEGSAKKPLPCCDGNDLKIALFSWDISER